MTAHANVRQHQYPKLSWKAMKTMRIRVPVEVDDYAMVLIETASKTEFLDAIKDALKGAYTREGEITKFVQSLFEGELALSGKLDKAERWFILDAVVRKGDTVTRRLFGED